MRFVLRSFLILFLLTHVSQAADRVDYLTDIKPLLEHKCYACHGALKQQGNLRLDTGSALLIGGDSGSPISSDPAEPGLLIDVLTGDAGFQMPPEGEGSPLTADEIRLVQRWIEQGANIPDSEDPQQDPRSWWSYQPVKRPDLPALARNNWGVNPIDYFIQSKRQSLKLGHVDESTKSEWLRRVYLDLTGLPPTRRQLLEFQANDNSRAYETIVDSLLDSPQYGERWGRHWMDIWRYSDWYGSRAINENRYSQRHIWRWRDWIVNSLNDNKGYDQMVREMLAADEIAGDDPNTVVATGYLGRNWYKFDRNVRMFDTVEKTSEAFLGLTFRCARCHDHKYDPITQEEYYQFRAFFEPQYVRYDPVSLLAGTGKDPTLGEYPEDGLAVSFDLEPERPTYRFNRGDDRFPDESKVLLPGVPKALGGPAIEINPVALPAEAWYPILRQGVRETLIAKATKEVVAAVAHLNEKLLERDELQNKLDDYQTQTDKTGDTPKVFLHDKFETAQPDIWKRLKGAWAYEDGHLSVKQPTSFATMVTKETHPRDFTVHLKYRPLQEGRFRSIGFSYDFIGTGTSQDVYTSTGDARQTVQAFHRIGGKQTYPNNGIIDTELKVGELITLDVTVIGSALTIDLNGERTLEYELPLERQDGKFALWVHSGTAEFHELKIEALEESIDTLQRRLRHAKNQVELANTKVQLAKEKLVSVKARLKATIAEFIQNSADSNELKLAAIIAESKVAVTEAQYELQKLAFRPDSEDTKGKVELIQLRLADAQKALANPGDTFTPLGEQYSKTSTGRRSALAQWITSPQNPRTARVAINHIWGRHFGQPLVATTENFGLNGKTPTHPELLDWLAAELMDNEWKMKKIHKLIVLSSTYRMSTHSDGAALKHDPNNHYLWRMNSRRMEAEVVRDSILHLSGQLDLTRGGPELDEDQGQTIYRRSMYFRNTPNEKVKLLEVFDGADPNSCYLRKESVVPHQALALMNSDLAQSSARVLAESLKTAGDDFIVSAFETILTRKPTKEELKLCQSFLSEHATLLNDDSSDRFAPTNERTRPPSNTPEIRARENLIHVLLLHNDFVTVR